MTRSVCLCVLALLTFAQPASAREVAPREDGPFIVEDVLIPTSDGANVSAHITRPRSTARLPALLEFTIYVFERSGAERSAARGYAGVVAYTRGKRDSAGAVVPYERDGSDARAVIEWISRQPWSDRRVAMYGSSYSAFTQWAAAKRLPSALRAIATSASVAPGIDMPMEGNIFQNFAYSWVHYVANNDTLDASTYDDSERWSALNGKWYKSGRSYRSLERIDGRPNPIFARWLDHPAYDEYWQDMIPVGDEFAGIDIPVLATTGYDDGGQVGVLHYFNEHRKHNPRADHTLLIGPYDHFAMQRGPLPVLRGYPIDAAAHVDLQELRWQWLDHVLKGAAKPALLKDKVNYQVMGANEWKHASSLDAMANERLRFYFAPGDAAGAYRLTEEQPARRTFIAHVLDLADRTDAEYLPAANIVNKTFDTHNGLAFVSEPLRQPVEISGLFSAELDFASNKKDMDVKLALYERLQNGDYFELPQHIIRASYARDRSRRQLLQPGRRARMKLVSAKLTSRRLQAGSRIVVVLSLIKQPDMQINYGTGAEVSDETIHSATVPLSVRWYGGSFIDIPIWK